MSNATETTSVENSATTEAQAPAKEDSVKTEASPAEEVKAEENVEAKFIDSLAEDLRSQKALQDFKDANGLAKSYLHLNSMIGKKIADLSSEELGEVYGKMGRPESADKYAMPDKASEDMVGWYKDVAFKLGLSQDQARNLAETYIDLEDQQIKAYEQKNSEQQEVWVSDLKKEFGSAFDKRVETAKKAVEAFGGSELREAMDATGLGNHPAMVKAFAQIGKEMLEGGLTQADAEASFGLTPSDAKQKIGNLKRDPEFMKAYMSATHPGHKEAVQEMQSYYELMHKKASS